MNAAFLLVATAWANGADPAPAAHPAHPPAAHPAPAAIHAAPPAHGACCNGGHDFHGYFDGGCCEDACDCDRPSFFERLCSRFRRNDDCCETTCDTCCDTHHAATDCECDTGCDRPGFFERLRARFHRGDDCCEDACECDTGCDHGCGHGFHGYHGYPGHAAPHGAGIAAPGQPAEKIPAPKGADDKGTGGDKPPDDKGAGGDKPVGKLPIGIPGAGNIPEVTPAPTTIREPF